MAVSRKNGSFNLVADNHQLCQASALKSSSQTPENIRKGRWFKLSTSFNSEPDPHTCKEFPCPVCDRARKKSSQANYGCGNLDIMLTAGINKPLPACNNTWRVDDNVTAGPASASASNIFKTWRIVTPPIHVTTLIRDEQSDDDHRSRRFGRLTLDYALCWKLRNLARNCHDSDSSLHAASASYNVTTYVYYTCYKPSRIVLCFCVDRETSELIKSYVNYL